MSSLALITSLPPSCASAHLSHGALASLRADPRGGHQPPAHRVVADRVEQHLVPDGQLLAHDPADAEQRLGDRGQPRKARDEFADPRLVSTATDDAYF